MPFYILQEDHTSKILLEDHTSALLQEPGYVEAATIGTVTTPSITEAIGHADTATIATKTQVTLVEFPLWDFGTVITRTTVTITTEAFLHATGQWGPFDTENG